MSNTTFDPGWGPAKSKQFGYDAITSKGRRRPPVNTTKAEGKLLDPQGRQTLNATTRDLIRNMSVAKWMISQHLAYCSTFDIQFTTADKGLNAYLADAVDYYGRATNFDAAGRHRADHFWRMAEARRVIDGDVGLLKLGDGRVQAIESDRIRNPASVRNFVTNPRQPNARGKWVNGVKVTEAGRALAYNIWQRKDGGPNFTAPRDIRAGRLWLYGFFDSTWRFDQVRGVSPLASAMNSLQDCHEAQTYAALKSKAQAMFAMVFSRGGDEAVGDVTGGGAGGDPEDKAGYDVDMGTGPISLDLDPGDKAEFLESKSPSNEFRAYMDHTITAALKALNLDITAYDPTPATWHGSRSAQLHYERSCIDARNDQTELRNKWTAWRLTLAAIDGELELPRGWTVQDVSWEWVHRGQPWWRPDQEIAGDIQAIGAGFSNPYRVCRERGQGTFEQNVDSTLMAIKYARQRGLEEIGQPLSLNFESDAAPVSPEPIDEESDA